MSILYWSYQNGDNNVITNKNYHFDNIENGRYLLILDTEIFTDDEPANNSDASIGFSVMNDYFSVTRCNHKYSVNISGNTIVDVNEGMLEIFVKDKYIDTYKFNHFKITLIPIQQ